MTLDNIKTLELSQLREEMQALKSKGFDYLSNLIGMDWGEEEGLGVVYCVENTQTHEQAWLKTATADREQPVIPTVSDLWDIANIYEREAYDFYGIIFAGHPDMRRITYGLGEGCDVRGENVRNLGEAGVELTVRHAGGAFPIRIPAFGSHLACAALAAAAVGLEFGLTGEEIARGVAGFQTVGERARIIHMKDYTLVSDCYNANPNSCRAALDSLAALNAARRVCILGDMLELGPTGARLHRGVGEYAAQKGIDLVIGCGPLSKNTVEGAREGGCETLYFPDKPALLERLDGLIQPGDCVLVKASLGMGFKELIQHLTKD